MGGLGYAYRLPAGTEDDASICTEIFEDEIDSDWDWIFDLREKWIGEREIGLDLMMILRGYACLGSFGRDWEERDRRLFWYLFCWKVFNSIKD